jgi:hypothetical protein
MLIKLPLSCIELINTKSPKAATNHHCACVRGQRHLVKSYSLYHNGISLSGSLLRQTTPAYIHENIQQNETTATDLQKVLHKETGTLISLSNIKRARSKLRWVQTGVKYCQLIRLQNKVKRLNFALKYLQTQDDFKDVIFTDESTAAIGCVRAAAGQNGRPYTVASRVPRHSGRHVTAVASVPCVCFWSSFSNIWVQFMGDKDIFKNSLDRFFSCNFFK